MIDVPEEFQNVSLENWAIGAVVVASMIAGNLGTEQAMTDEQINVSLQKLVATAPPDIQVRGVMALMGMAKQ